MTPLRAIKEHCKWCMGGSLQWVRECGDDICPLHPLREGRAVKGVSPLQTIRRKCRECVETSQDIRDCLGEMHNGTCPVHPFRFGRKPQKDAQKSSTEAIFSAERFSVDEVGG